VGFHKEGIEILKNDKQGVYQAVILDATGYLSEQDFEAENDLNNVGMNHSLRYLEGIKSERVVPWFIYSGQEKNFGNSEFEGTIKLYQSDYKFGRLAICYYRKSLDENALFEDIKVEIDKLQRTRVLLAHNALFDVIQGIPNLEKHRSTLIEILEEIHKQQDYTRVRKVIESLFQALADVHILPEGFTKEAGWINGTSRFLSCNHNEFDFFEPDFIHPTICETLYRLLNLVQDGSHNEGSLKYKVDEYSKLHSTGYLYQSIVYALLEIICYFGYLIKNNPDKEKNKARYKDNWIQGTISLLTPNGWAAFESDCKKYNLRIPERFVSSDFKIGIQCRIRLKKENQNHVNKVEII